MSPFPSAQVCPGKVLQTYEVIKLKMKEIKNKGFTKLASEPMCFTISETLKEEIQHRVRFNTRLCPVAPQSI